ncbi:hypothetical protein [Paraburkholderia rhynchosiae]|uniref:Uncharacterized protein n=1 Tax=Paraburkholderia rhynchosiae TaxID=487049 RepID=A0A2N7VKX5_9BURK|nr:hypothetical protein [Paraburkholderia rhynchosiae]PMS17798.1 hypothetical protein C0Z16_36335 [Paraburkholderia rhynchosiae]CAB3744420.1 hypothetical protein LMG27174_07174 [Paraburkholderia rhynchosiae]
MDDRFDRRELLLHLGDMLQSLGCLARTGARDTPVLQLAKEHDLFRDFEFLQALAPQMTVADFSTRVANAFFRWPEELLDIELNRKALASTVQQELFDGNPDGWNSYVGYLRKRVKWFGDGLPGMTNDAGDEPLHDAAEEVNRSGVASSREREVSGERKGWPWPEPRTTT